ncbi:MAG: TcpE family conjugal transfer membrane protein [Streptosporangiaceae bacterium]
MDLPTYTNIWRIEKRLYKLYDFRLPAPLPITWIAVFTGITVPYVVFLIAVGLPFNHNLVWLYVLPPGVLTWLTTRPVIENKRLPELVTSQLRYVSEPRTWCRMAPFSEKDEIFVSARIWHRYPPKIKKVTSKSPIRARLSRPALSQGVSRRAEAGVLQLDDIMVETAEFEAPPSGMAQSDAAQLEAPRPEAPPLDLPPAKTRTLAAKTRPVRTRLPAVRRPAIRRPTLSRPPVSPSAAASAEPESDLVSPAASAPTVTPTQPAPVQPAPVQSARTAETAPAPDVDAAQIPVHERSGPPRAPRRAPAQPRSMAQPPRGQEQPRGQVWPSAQQTQPEPGFTWSPWPHGAQQDPGPSAAGDGGTAKRPAWMIASQPEAPDPRALELSHDTALELSHDVDPDGQVLPTLSAGPASWPSAEAGPMARFRRLPEPGPFAEAGAFPEVGAFPELDPADDLGAADREPADDLDTKAPAWSVASLRSLRPRLRWTLRAQPRPPAQPGPEAEPLELEIPEAAVQESAPELSAPEVSASALSAPAPFVSEPPAPEPPAPQPPAPQPPAQPAPPVPVTRPIAVTPPVQGPAEREPAELRTTEPETPQALTTDVASTTESAASPATPEASAIPPAPATPQAPAPLPAPSAPTAQAQASAQAQAPAQAGTAQQAGLDRGRLLPSIERALSGPDSRDEVSWRRQVKVVTGRQGPGKRDQESQDRERIRRPLDGPRRIVVLGCTRGAGQTVTALMIGHILAAVRGEAVAALDLSSGPASLASRREPAASIRDLLASQQPGPDAAPAAASGARFDIIADLAATGSTETGPATPAAPRPLEATEYQRLAELLSARYRLTLIDPAPAGLMRVLSSADQLVLVAPASPDAATALVNTLQWLGAHGYGDLASRAVTVINGVSRRTNTDALQTESVARGRCRAIVRVPWDDLVSARSVPQSSLQPQTKIAYTALVGVLVAGLAGNGGPERNPGEHSD